MPRMKISIAALATTGMVALLGLAPAGADPDVGSGDSTFNPSDSNGTETGSASSDDGTSSSGGVPTASGDLPPPLFDYGIVHGREEVGQEAGFDAPGCWGVIEVAPTDPDGVSYAEASAGADEWGGNGSGQGRCVDDPAEVFDLVAYVLETWRTAVRPPPPSPLAVQPGKALTGLRAYLEIGGDVPYELTIPNPIGPAVQLTATPRYVVSWGDGTTAETTSQGVPWPGGPGEISHVFTETGGVTIAVEAYWHGTWSAGDQGGDLPELPVPTEGGLDLPVEERQAVIDE